MCDLGEEREEEISIWETDDQARAEKKMGSLGPVRLKDV